MIQSEPGAWSKEGSFDHAIQVPLAWADDKHLIAQKQALGMNCLLELLQALGGLDVSVG